MRFGPLLSGSHIPYGTHASLDYLAVGLLQTTTHAVKEMVAVRDNISSEAIQIPWTYAYYELAERHLVEVAPGQQALFNAFLGQNAQYLFEITKLLA